MAGVVKGGVAVVTGGATGIGFALARQLADRGMKVILASTNRERLDKAVAAIRAEGGTAVAEVCDVTDRAAVRALAARVEQEHGPVDLLCANAGGTTTGTYLEHDDGDWDWSIDVNLRGATNSLQAFYPAMAERGSGHIVLTGSQTAYAPDWVLQHGPYVAAKAAVHTLVFTMRQEAAERGVALSLLVPAGTDTEVLKGQRSRPDRYGSAREGGLRMGENLPELGTEGLWLSADEVARRAIVGIDANLPVIITHPAMRPLVKHYFDRILAAYDTAAEAAIAAGQPA
ncbi:MAG: SDR family oxidoreductase [Sphingomonadaceae bacterium]|nr:SDR family oxidoreductase [Sphingomonadaceae bacterium]